MAYKVKPQNFTSPRGELEWVTIEGEGKENLSGKMQYVANLVVDADDDIVAKIEKFWNENKPPKFKKEAKSNGLYSHTTDSGKVDEDGKKIYEPDGKLYLAFKTGVTFADGKTKKVQVHNAKGAKVELPEGTNIGNGSIGKISGAMGIYTSESKTGTILDAGVTLYLNAIQIIKLEEFSQDAGFGEEEGGDFTGESDFEGVEETEAPATGTPRL